ncbi:hypothetical protein [Maribellus sp. YY47]|nr:hypothetical protein [Maribellus sp. YY47]MCK3682667.1 hypothetical protein [Maribellus sp. YY47]
MKGNNKKLETSERGSVWEAKIGLRSGISEKTYTVFRKSKKWEMHIYLN